MIKPDKSGKRRGPGEDQEHDSTQAAVECALLHFSTPKDAATIAAVLRTRVYRPDSLVWLEGYQALIRWRAENEITGLYAVPYDVETKLAALRSYRRATGHLAPRQDAVWSEGTSLVAGAHLMPIGQHMANVRRKGGLGKDSERAQARAAQLAAIDPDWNEGSRSRKVCPFGPAVNRSDSGAVAFHSKQNPVSARGHPTCCQQTSALP